MWMDGKQIAEQKQKNLAERLKKENKKPHLAVVLVGDFAPSQIYVSKKQKACESVGIDFRLCRFPHDVSEEVLLQAVCELNQDSKIHGILIQLPLPSHLPSQKILQSITPQKDVDGLTIFNQGSLSLGLSEAMIPCTPLAVMELLYAYDVPLRGQRAVVIGRSALVGWPVVQLLNRQGATVSCVHSQTKNPQVMTRDADILVVAAGVPHLVNADWVKQGSVVVDVGIHKTQNQKIQGDVDTQGVAPYVKLITPVPGGVGPMTIACLLDNCLKAYTLCSDILAT